MGENLKAILKAIMADDDLRRAYEADVLDVSGRAYAEALLAFASDHGFELTAADLEGAGAPAGQELAEDELMAVTGGGAANDSSHGCGEALAAVDDISQGCGTPAVISVMQSCGLNVLKVFFPES